MRHLAIRLVLLLSFAACSSGGTSTATKHNSPPAEAPKGPVIISIVGTNDLHGKIGTLPVLAGHVRILRTAREADGGGVLLLDAGDIFQGTLESNLNEGHAAVAAYNAMGYDAVTVGNHEFDFGPAGEKHVPMAKGDDPRGALKARAAEAAFPFLMANVVDAETGRRPTWPNMPPAVLKEVAGVRVGIIGVTTFSTPHTTMPANFVGLKMLPLAQAISEVSRVMKSRGANVVIVIAHAGGKCKELRDPSKLDSCDADSEIFEVARALPAHTVDVIVAGHTHAGIAHQVNGIAIIEAFTRGVAFGRVDLVFDRTSRTIVDTHILPPHDLCTGKKGEPCNPADYEGKPVVADETVAAKIADAFRVADEQRNRPLGVSVAKDIWPAYDHESPLGNLFTDLMLFARPHADIALTNGGGLRAVLPAGPLKYGSLYEASPFDNRFATIKLTGAQLEKVMAINLERKSGIFLLSGARMVARCVGSNLDIALFRDTGKQIADGDSVVIATSDFLASGGDGIFTKVGLSEDAIELHSGETIRDEMAAVLRKRGGTLDPSALYDPKRPRLTYPRPRPVRCQ